MAKPILLVGNGINNISNNVSWSQLLKDIIDDLGVSVDKNTINSKPFPLLYEEIYIKSVQQGDMKEYELKKTISDKVGIIVANEIHERITSGIFSDILTTNYELTLEDCISDGSKLPNLGIKRELKFSVFRHSNVNDINFWHIHGDMGRPASILLGYEHYSGQLQMMREYVMHGHEKDHRFNPLDKRIGQDDYELLSWIDHFFTGRIHIVGLTLNFIETDLWWLITYRARKQHEKLRSGEAYEAFAEKLKASEITYYYPAKYRESSKEKLQLMESFDIKTVAIERPHDVSYYHEVLNRIEAS
ncbi:MAG: SIR2 family protein [Bacteroidota bacterium]